MLPIWIVALTFTACIETYNPKIDDYLDLPVVEGTITNEPGPYYVRLSRSIALENMGLTPIRHAQVIISDDAGHEERLTEQEPGIYATLPAGIRGEIGRKYRITIETEGKTYQSAYEELQEPVGIDSVYAQTEYRETSDGQEAGLQFYVNAENLQGIERQFLWTITETYEFHSEFKLDYIYYRIDSIVKNYGDSGEVCWHTYLLPETYDFSTEYQSDPVVRNFPLHYVSTKTNRISVRYSVLIRQMTISEEAYRFWHEVKKMNEESGSLYTRQPYQIRGNLTNSSNPDDIILGYFITAGVSTKRIFVDRPDLPFDYTECHPATDVLTSGNPNDLRFPLYATILPSGEEGFSPLYCFDCVLQGGTEQKPYFWEE